MLCIPLCLLFTSPPPTPVAFQPDSRPRLKGIRDHIYWTHHIGMNPLDE